LGAARRYPHPDRKLLDAMKFQWFALHVLAGKEQKVRDSINRRLKIDEMEPYIREVLLPMEKVVEVRGEEDGDEPQAPSGLPLRGDGPAR